MQFVLDVDMRETGWGIATSCKSWADPRYWGFGVQDCHVREQDPSRH